jgi:2-polyprenyl-6-methoxyphenol hydroxylase-like FAD-dependent oxidoreductase
MTTTYDAIVVGARVAGSPTAMLLAQQGYRVLLVDRATFPSDTLSTLMITAPGTAALDRWGLLDEVRASGAPPVETHSFDFGPFTIKGTPPPYEGHSAGYAPRRTVLDKILVDAAARAGAEVRERFAVEQVLVEDGVVVGIRGRGVGGVEVVERGKVVIGADGRNSRVAEAVRPERYHEQPRLQHPYYTFWSDLPVDGFEVVIRPDRGWAALPTNDGLTVLVVGWPFAERDAFRSDIEGNFLKTLELSPEWAERVRGARRVDRFYGGASYNYFTKPYGPGWALVGDAGYIKDPITAQGIRDAFRDAELVAGALGDVFEGRRSYEEAMSTYQHTRDEQVLPLYGFTTQLATLEAPPPEMQQLLGAVSRSQAAMDAFVGVNAGTVSPAEFFDPANIGRLLGAPAA